MEQIQLKLSDILFDETIYPRKTHNPAKVQEYADNLDAIEAARNYMSVSANKKLLDGRHRHIAYLTNYQGKETETTITVNFYPEIIETKDEYVKAIELNSAHGQQLTKKDKEQACLNLYAQGWTNETIAKTVSVSKAFVTAATKERRQEDERKLNEKMFDLWLQCYTYDEIADAIGIPVGTVKSKLSDKEWLEKYAGTNSTKLSFFQDDGFDIPVYNIWRKQTKTNDVDHFGNSEPTWLENLIYLYTEPFDIVVDPFAGGGSTIDICIKRFRRFWCSDRKPIVPRQDEIRPLDVTVALPPLNKNWSSVSLTFLDPPYWKQAEGRYSKDKEDLANMPLDQFTATLVTVIKGIAQKQSKGVIALMIQPTQWNTNDAHEWTDHVIDVCCAIRQVKNLRLENRISVPYSTQQCNAQMVTAAKTDKFCLCLTRELIIWKVC